MTLTQQDKLFVFWINMHIPRNGHHFKFGDYLDLVSFILNLKKNSDAKKNFVNISIGLLQEIVLSRC